MRFLNLESVDVIGVFNVLVNDLQVRLLRDFVSDDSNAEEVGTNVVN